MTTNLTFTVIWPLLLWLAWRIRISFLLVTVTLATLSFTLNVWRVNEDIVGAFYSPQTRFWELLIGSLLAYATLSKNISISFFLEKRKSYKKILSNLLSVIGLLLIFTGFVVLTRAQLFPGFWALLPTLGAVFVIAAGPEAWFNRQVLANRVLVWFGVISFPLYLWHWLLLTFLQITQAGSSDLSVRTGAVILSIIFAWLTYLFVEKPVRYSKYKKVSTIALSCLMLTIGMIG